MNAYATGLPVVYLKPGEMFFSTTPSLIVTVLGSCLSVTMYNPRLAIGAICHGILAHCDKHVENCDGCLEPFKYVDCSIREMLKAFRQFNVKARDVEIKIFGGADMFGKRPVRKGIDSVGRQNIKAARQVFKREGLATLSADTGGRQGRKIFFFTQTGEVLLKRLRKGEEANEPASSAKNKKCPRR